MGWFDDSDSDDDGGTSNKSSSKGPGLIDLNDDLGGTAAAATSNNVQDKQDAEEDEVDPLDAFMLDNQTKADQDVKESKRRADDGDDGESTSNANDSNKRSRLDVDNEEESTSHWTDRAASSSTSTTNIGASRKRLLPGYDKEEGRDNDQSTAASYTRSGEAVLSAASMASTFQKGGDGYAEASDARTEEQDLDDPDSVAKLPQQQQHQEIDPLAKIDHRGVTYNSFERKFHSPVSLSQSGQQWRKDNDVLCSLSVDPILNFQDISSVLQQEVMDYLIKSGYQSPTLVQSQTLPVALSGKNCIVTASTGSGKTLSYALPLTVHCIAQEHIQPGVDGPIGLVLTPTRELAAQVHKQCHRLLRTLNGRAVCVTGGNRGTWELSKDLKTGCEVIVSTPGRLIDLVRADATNLRRVTMIILDEADRMLSMGFEKQVNSIMENVRPDRQTMMFSATFGRRVERVAREWLVDPVRISIGRTGMSSEHVSQHVLVLPFYHAKKQWMMEMLPTLADVGRMIVFVSSRADCEDLAKAMQSSPTIGGKGLRVDSIHGDKHQTDRNAALAALRKGHLAALVATDVAARGLDVQDIMTVVNFDCAKNYDSHVHRLGRAGRMSAGAGDVQQKKGVAYTLLTSKNADFANTLVEAFVREGRHVGDDLLNLARQSKHFGGGGGNRSKKSKSGIGHHAAPNRGNSESGGGNYYGPSGTMQAGGR